MNYKRWDKIFHPTDFTRGDEAALAHALKLAILSKAELDLVHTGPKAEEAAWEDFPHIRTMLEEWNLIHPGASHTEVRELLGLEVKKVRQLGAEVVQALIEQIESADPDLVVLATHQRRGFNRWAHKSVAEPVAREGRRLTLFVPRRVVGFITRETGAVSLDTILIPIDKSPRPQLAVDAAIEMAETLKISGARFVLLYVGNEEDMPEVNVPEIAGWLFERTAWQGNVVDHILSVAEEQNADLIVMTTHGHDGFLDAFRGSTTERVLRAAKCPVLAVHG